jgi:hypothetical protein
MTRKIETARGRNLLRTVDELIDPTTGEWDIQTLTDTFSRIEVQWILQIPVSQNLEEDFVAWHKTQSFSFTVRSA